MIGPGLSPSYNWSSNKGVELGHQKAFAVHDTPFTTLGALIVKIRGELPNERFQIRIFVS